MQTEKDISPETFAEIVAQALTGAFRACCTSALDAVIGPATTESLPADQQSVWFGMNLGGSLQGRAYLAVAKAEIPALGLRDAGDTQEAETAALLNLLQATGPRLQELAASPYGALTMAMEQAAGPALPGSRALKVYAKSEEGSTRATLYLYLEPQLITGLQRLAGVLFPEATPVVQSRAENLGLVLDVELNATLRFGQRQLSLREILDLTSGSVVELDRQVDEPVELVLDGRVIAHGEAVIIDGNYGMRITEILHPVTGIARSK